MNIKCIKNISKRNIILASIVIALVATIGIGYIFGKNISSNNKDAKVKTEQVKSKKLINYVDDNYEYKLVLKTKKNKIKEYKITMLKSEEQVFKQVVKKEKNKAEYSIDIKDIIFEKGYGAYRVVVEYKSGLFNKKENLEFVIDKVRGVKNASIEEDYLKQKYIAVIDTVPDSIAYRAVVTKDSNVKAIEVSADLTSPQVKIDISEIVKEFGVGKYTVQIENVISTQIKGEPKFTTFVAKKIIEKPKVKFKIDSMDNKILTVTNPKDVAKIDMEIFKGVTLIARVRDVKTEFNLTAFLKEKNQLEGMYSVKIIPVIDDMEYYVVDSLNETSIAKLNSIQIKYETAEVKEIGGADLPIINRPWISLSNVDSQTYKYYVKITGDSLNYLYEYIPENNNVITNDDVRLAGGRYFLRNEQVQSIKIGEKITIAVYKEDKNTKIKSYETIYKMEKKTTEALLKIDALQVIQ